MIVVSDTVAMKLFLADDNYQPKAYELIRGKLSDEACKEITLMCLGQVEESSDDLFKAGNNKRCIEDNTPHAESTVLFKMEEEWTPLSELGCNGIDFELFSSNDFLDYVKVQGFVDDDGYGYPIIKADNGTFLYNEKKPVYPSKIQNKNKLDFDYIAWFNK